MFSDLVYPGAIVMLSPEDCPVTPTYYVVELAEPKAWDAPPVWGFLTDHIRGRLAAWTAPAQAVLEAHQRAAELAPAAAVVASSRPIGSGPFRYGLVAPPDCVVLYVVTRESLQEQTPVHLPNGRKSIERAIREAVHREQVAREKGAGHVHTPPQ